MGSSTEQGTPCFVDATVQQYVDEAVLRRAGENEVGLVIGRRRKDPEKANCILQLIRTPPPEQQCDPGGLDDTYGAEPTVMVTRGGDQGLKMSIRSDWVCEHAVQIARILPGGIEILGVYVLCDGLVFDTNLLCSVLKELNAARISTFSRHDADVLLHVYCGRIRAHELSGSRLRVCTQQNADLLHELIEVRTKYPVSITLRQEDFAHPVKQGASACDVIEKAINAEMDQRALHCAFQGVARVGEHGPSSMAELVREHIKRGGLDHVPITLDVPKVSGSVESAPHAVLDCRAFVFEDETLEDALQAVKTDIESTLRSRMDILSDVEDLIDGSATMMVGKTTGTAAPSSVGAWLFWPRLPSRAFFSWKRGGGAYCDYIFPGEGAHEVLERLRKLVGPMMVDARRFTTEERPPVMTQTKKRPGALRALILRCNVMIVGTVLCALLALLSCL